MARQLRIEYEDAVYHVLARGNRLDPIFTSDEDHELFLRTMDEACGRTGFKIYAWVLMRNHYHAVIRTPNANLVEGMQWLQNTYTRRFNSRHRKWGRLFGDRYKSILVDDASSSTLSGGGSYLTTLIDYVHLNPARARIIQAQRGESLLDYPWSSIARGYALPPKKRASGLDVTGGLELFGYADSARNRRQFVARLDERMAEEEADRCGLAEIKGQSLQSTLQRGWYWGTEVFRENALARIEKLRREEDRPNRNYAASPQGKDHSRHIAHAILTEGAKHFGLHGPESARELGRGDRRRVAIAWALWRRTSMPQRWIAEQTGLKSPANVSQQVCRYDRLPARELPRKEQEWRKQIL